MRVSLNKDCVQTFSAEWSSGERYRWKGWGRCEVGEVDLVERGRQSFGAYRLGKSVNFSRQEGKFR